MASSSSAFAIGIDLGTTYSCVGVLVNGRVEIIEIQDGKKTMPSYISFTETGRLVGERARERSLIDPENTVNNMKRLIGRTMDDDDVQNDIETFLFEVVDDNCGNPNVRVNYEGRDVLFRPEEISAAILEELKIIAEEFLKSKGFPDPSVQDAVITVPAYFTTNQRQATMDAGKIAGLNVLGTINEPTAAALAYGFNNMEDNSPHKVLVYDFGGGTFDVSVLEVVNGHVTALSIGGNRHLGGEDIDNLLVKHFCSEFEKKYKIDLEAECNGYNDVPKKALRRLRFASEKAKIALSVKENSDASIELDLLYKDHDMYSKITRRFFETLCSNLIRSTMETVEHTVEDANLSLSDITDIILVGGSTRIPMVTEMLVEVFPQVPICAIVNPDEAVAFGATIRAAILTGVDPRIVRNVRLIDVTPMSLGLDTAGGLMAVIINRNTPLPVRRKKTFSTSKDYQTEICFQVFEGERHMTAHNFLLGEFTLVGIAPAPRRLPQIEVTFEVDENSMLKVTAKDLIMNSESSIEISNIQGRLNPEDLDRVVQEARRMRQKDIEFKKQIEARGKLEVYASKIDRSLKSHKFKEKIGDEQLRIIKEKVDESLVLYEDYEDPKEIDFEEKYTQLENLWLSNIMKNIPGTSSGNALAPTVHDESLFE